MNFARERLHSSGEGDKLPLETPRSGGGYPSLGFMSKTACRFWSIQFRLVFFFCTRLKLGQNSQFLFGRLLPATFVAAALARFPAAPSPKAAQKGQLAKGRRGERAEEEEQEWEGEGAQRDRDAAPRRQDLGDVNEGHCEGRRTERGEREGQNGDV